MYAIDVERPHDLIVASLSGSITVREVGEYIRELKRQVVAHRLRTYAMMIDVSDCPIQSQEMIRSMGEHMATMPRARALAVVTGSSLARLQIRRLFTQPYVRITATADQARGWVISGIEPADRQNPPVIQLQQPCAGPRGRATSPSQSARPRAA